ncbi:hypothetical protein G3A50_08590 [Ancylobacter pratisalsi]|uniref:Extensin-like C-terminal domain-containing protein n=2 Tax=Ancylobacter pratisalsi TaxID=1745854 RepID=A0A6P1YS00_9HYPH|nr:hypothetical protein G3A50_08590 [Ancylobacter pratisalsi]
MTPPEQPGPAETAQPGQSASGTLETANAAVATTEEPNSSPSPDTGQTTGASVSKGATQPAVTPARQPKAPTPKAAPARAANSMPLPLPSPERRIVAAPSPALGPTKAGAAQLEVGSEPAAADRAEVSIGDGEVIAMPKPSPVLSSPARSSARLKDLPPLPRPRPADASMPLASESARLAALTPGATPAIEGGAPAPQSVPTICPELSNEDLGVFTPAVVTATNPLCTVDRAVSLSAVRMKDGRLVELEPAAVLRCEMAASVAHWLREEVAPAIATLGSPLDKVLVAASQQCRPRNRVAGAKISEHGRGNAMDTRGYRLADGRVFVIGPGKGEETPMPQAFQEKLKASACADFTTILGPGSDGYHEHHLHMDRAVRRSGMVLCQWAISGAKADGDSAEK